MTVVQSRAKLIASGQTTRKRLRGSQLDLESGVRRVSRNRESESSRGEWTGCMAAGRVSVTEPVEEKKSRREEVSVVTDPRITREIDRRSLRPLDETHGNTSTKRRTMTERSSSCHLLGCRIARYYRGSRGTRSGFRFPNGRPFNEFPRTTAIVVSQKRIHFCIIAFLLEAS